jgi:hypothetical protein
MDPVDIKVYTNHHSPRLDFTLKVLLGDILGLNFEVVTDKRRIGNTPVINYSPDAIADSFRIVPSGLLEGTSVEASAPDAVMWNDIPVLFANDGGGNLPFDIMAASFWMLSRYEEYQPFTPDRHGRFPAEASLAFRSGFLQQPVVEIWAARLSLELIRHFPFIAFKRSEFSVEVTFDIDQAFAYRGKGLLRGAAGFVSDVVKGSAMERFRSVSGTERDPYDVYEYIMGRLDDTGVKSFFFFPFGSLSEFDRNNPYGTRVYRDLVRAISGRYSTGIHFSYSSGREHGLMNREIERFMKVAGFSPDISRQHYLLFPLPSVCRALEANGILADYTLGYASRPGFRAGISRPFRFYDLPADRETGLTLSPFALMDVTLKDYMQYDTARAKEVAGELIAQVKGTGGRFATVWHNSSLTEREGWEGWRSVFEHILKQCGNNDTVSQKQ